MCLVRMFITLAGHVPLPSSSDVGISRMCVWCYVQSSPHPTPSIVLMSL